MYKRWLLLLLLLCLTVTPAFGDNEYAILRPSEIESLIAPGRDFYVVAAVPSDAQSATVRLMNDQSETVREITGGVTPVFFTGYEHLNAFNTDQAVYQMPDLIYDPANPGEAFIAPGSKLIAAGITTFGLAAIAFAGYQAGLW